MSKRAVKRAARLADAWMPSPMVTWPGECRQAGGALFRETPCRFRHRSPAKTFSIIRGMPCRQLARRYESRCPSSTRLMHELERRFGFRPVGRHPRRLRGVCPPAAFIIGSENEVVDRIGAYGERTGTDHILLRVQWPGLGQKTVIRTLERLGRVVEKLGK